MTQYTSGLPMPMAPLVDPQTGMVTPIWFPWFLAIFARTGGAVGASVVPIIANQAAPGVAVVLGGSPFTYTAPSHGSILVGGSGVIRLEITANGTTFYPTGAWYGAFPLASGSKARLTYIGSPAMTFIPT